MEAVEPLAGEELERMLARYARVRLEPSQALTRRARSAVMEEAWRRRLDPQSVLRAPAAGSLAASSTPARRLPFSGWGPRRLGLAFTAATLAGLMLGSSAFAASRAGGPLYESRLALEDLTLPADAAARMAAQLAQADARLGEAVEAGFRHDDRAVAAALDAYDRTLEDLASASGAAADEALEAIRLHQTVLLQLATQVPSTATNGIDIALANGDRLIARLAEGGAGGPETGSGNDGSPRGNGFGANGGGNAAGGAGAGQGGGNAGGNGGGNSNGPGTAARTPRRAPRPRRRRRPTPRRRRRPRSRPRDPRRATIPIGRRSRTTRPRRHPTSRPDPTAARPPPPPGSDAP